MRLELSDDQRLLQDSFERLFRSESSPARVRAAEPSGFDPALWNDLQEMGALAMRAKVSAGGGGFALLDALVVVEEAGRALASAPWTEAIVTSRLLAEIDGDAAQALFRRILDSGAIVTLALNDVGEQPLQIVPGGAVAEIVLGLEGDRIIAFTQGRQQDFLSNLGDLPIAQWAFAQGTVLASGADAKALFLGGIEEWKLLTAAELNGMARRSVEIAAAYANERMQFGKLIGANQGIAHPLADLIIAIDGARLLNWWSAVHIARSDPEAYASVPMSFWWSAATSSRAVERAVHTHGGYGLSLEYDVQLFYRRAKARALVLGDPADQLLDVGQRLWHGVESARFDGGEATLDFDFGEEARALAAETNAFFEANLTPELRAKAHFSFEGHDWDMHQKLGEARLLFPSRVLPICCLFSQL